MIRLFGWFAFAAVAYGSALVVLTPASYLAGLAPDALKPFVRDARGSVWSGQISIGPANDSRVDLSWRFSPKALAKACAAPGLEARRVGLENQASLPEKPSASLLKTKSTRPENQ